MKNLILMILTILVLVSCTNEKKVPKELKTKIKNEYNGTNTSDNKSLFKRRPKLSEVKECTLVDTVRLPDWIANKRYVTENVDAIKYKPAFLLGALTKVYDDGSFEIYSVTYNVRLKDDFPVLTKIEKPTNFYEQTFNENTRFNSSFIIGGAYVENEQIVKVTYTETNYGILEKYDKEKIEELRKTILSIEGANLKDWAIISGVVLLDCTSSKNQKTEISANVKASWITSDGGFYKQTGNTDNFRLLSIDLENLFLQKSEIH